jgi:hemin uptake protein HemP
VSALRRIALRVALATAVGAACWAAQAGGAGAQASAPPCAPGTPPLPPPTVNATGDPSSPERIVAGRPFTIEYDSREVVVQDTAGPPGTTFSSNNATGELIGPTVPTPGTAVFTVRYFAIGATAATACTQSTTFTVNVELGDLVSARIGYAEGPTIKLIGRFDRLPKRGALTGGAPVAGLLFPCTDTTARLPIVAELRIERNLRTKPSVASPLRTLTLPDPCGPKPSAALARGARIRHANIFDNTWTVAVEHRFGKGARYWLRITQSGRLLGQLRYYVAYRPQARRFAEVWVIAPEAAFEQARCNPPRRGDPTRPLGFRKFPIPPCPR